MGSAGSAARLEVDYTTIAAAARLLSLFAEFPSTPEEIAREAAATARELAVDLPFPPGVVAGGRRHSQAHPHPSTGVTLTRRTVVSCAGLLGVLGGMPSTPPDLRAEAGHAAESLWRLAGEV